MPLTTSDVSNLTEENAREVLERIRCPNGFVCEQCGSSELITQK